MKMSIARKPQTRQNHWRTRNGCFIKGELFSLKKAIVVCQLDLGRSVFGRSAERVISVKKRRLFDSFKNAQHPF